MKQAKHVTVGCSALRCAPVMKCSHEHTTKEGKKCGLVKETAYYILSVKTLQYTVFYGEDVVAFNWSIFGAFILPSSLPSFLY